MQPRRFSRAMACLLAGVLSLPPATVWAGPADDLRDLVGVKGAAGEADLERRGYTHIDTSKSAYSSFSYWWSNARSSCIRVSTRDGRYDVIADADPSDCGQTKKESGMSDGAKVAVGAAALLGIAALAHKSHHRDDRNYDERQTADFERGYRDGMYNNSYNNYNDSREYSDGYNKGVDERRHQSSYRYGYGNANHGPDWVRCASEGSFCNFRGAGVVRFGIDGRFVTRRGYDGMGCDLRTFGDDPWHGRVKECFVRQDGR